jgi:hypothetical protein
MVGLMHNLIATSSETDIQSGLACLRDFFLAERILISFNAPVAGILVSGIGVVLRQHIEAISKGSTSAIDVFSVYIEMSQNICNYVKANDLTGVDDLATMVIAETLDGHYQVSAGNILKTTHGMALSDYINHLSCLNKQELKQLYKHQLRQPRIQRPGQGAGLGLIDIARKSSKPLQCGLAAWQGGKSFFAIRATI